MLPRLLHQAWVGPTPIPEREKVWCEQMRAMNQTWNVRLYGNELLERYGRDPYVSALTSQNKAWAFVCDRLRVLLLRDEGGGWLDPDCQPLKPLDSLKIWDSPNIEFGFSLRSPYRQGVALHRGISLADNTFIASAPGSRLIKRVAALWTPQRIVVDGHATGCEVLANLDGLTDAVLNYRYFYDMQPTPDAIVLHDSHNLASWVPSVKPHLATR